MAVLVPDDRCVAPRFGGELPLNCDPQADEPWSLPDHVVALSSGRAAIAWFLQRRGPFRSVALSAYTCPSLYVFFGRTNFVLGMFDHGSGDVATVACELPPPCLVILPAFFGLKPWCDSQTLSSCLPVGSAVLVDAAQSAFAALDWQPPKGGAVLSCPRKSLAIGDGALLAMDDPKAEEMAEAGALACYPRAADIKQRARALFARGDAALEYEALSLSRDAEAALPETPHAITSTSLSALLKVDRAVYAARRRTNFLQLRHALDGKVEWVPQVPGDFAGDEVPFGLPLLHDNRDDFLGRLHARRVFATPLWPDASHNPLRHLVAADLSARLVSLPIDQRYEVDEMRDLGRIVLECL